VLNQLPSMYKSKFVKMISSRDGKGVARVEGEICGSCNFKIPSFLAIEASKDDKVVNCTNCGKYIYK
jgi:predicted  nucleic acid-binding Zn-ribbon protein